MGKRKGPKRLILLRHAEKTGFAGDADLSLEGVRRAAILADAIPQTFGGIDFIIAARSRTTSRRPYLTVEPLAAALGLAVQEDWDDAEGEALAKALWSGKRYSGQGVICWRHNALQALAKVLGAQEAPPWPRPVYDRFWVLDFHRDAVQFHDIPQPV
ncbi:MAG TPA: hypothetical protein VD906_04390 [Caulobacteraceae bacterium]|nr:hypothetical protein [Caulobacteraceae bacterium]